MEPLYAAATAMPAVSALSVLAVAAGLLLIVSRALRSWLVGALVFPAPTHGRSMAGIDALRGLAAIWVALFHFWQWPALSFELPLITFPIITYGAKAVPLFVVISGFVIWGTATHIATAYDLRRYAINRILRLFPLYVAVVLTTMILGYVISRGALPGQSMWKTALHELIMARSFNSQFFVLPQSWSLFIEVNFYVLAPIAAVLLTRKRLAILSVLSLALFLSEFAGDAREFGLWKYFFVGMLARELTDRPPASVPDAVPLIAFAAGVGLLLLDFRYDWITEGLRLFGFPVRPVDPDLTLALGLAAGALIYGAANSPLLERILGVVPLRILGVISYSVFLWHSVLISLDMPIRFAANGAIAKLGPKSVPTDLGWPLMVIVLPALLLVGTVSFLLIERPFLRLRPRRDPKASSDALSSR